MNLRARAASTKQWFRSPSYDWQIVQTRYIGDIQSIQCGALDTRIAVYRAANTEREGEERGRKEWQGNDSSRLTAQSVRVRKAVALLQRTYTVRRTNFVRRREEPTHLSPYSKQSEIRCICSQQDRKCIVVARIAIQPHRRTRLHMKHCAQPSRTFRAAGHSGCPIQC
jgi:hypothetical protein